MADLLPSIPDASAPEDAEPRVVGLEDEDAEEVLGALSSTTARELFAALNEDPAHPSALADTVDTSLQNTQYHLGKLEDAGIVEVVDTAYSAKGREMDVYAPADRPLVLFAGDEEDQTLLHRALGRLLGGVGVLAGASLAVRGLAGAGESGSNDVVDRTVGATSSDGSGNAAGDDGAVGDGAGGDDGAAGDGAGGDDGAAGDGAGGDDGAAGDEYSADSGDTTGTGGEHGDVAGDDGGAADADAHPDDGGAADADAPPDDGADTESDAADGGGETGGASDSAGGDETETVEANDGADLAQDSQEPAEQSVEPLAQEFAWIAEPLDATGLPPELAVFVLGGCLLALGVAAWYWRKRQTSV